MKPAAYPPRRCVRGIVLGLARAFGILAGLALTAGAQETWTAVNSGTTQNLWGITWGANQFVAVGEGGTILTSPDGLAWTRRVSGNTLWLTSVGYGNGQFVVVGDQGTILTSAGGVTWTTRRTGGTRVNAVMWGNGMFLAIDEGGGSWGSRDGLTWTFRATAASGTQLRGLAYAAPLFVITGASGTVQTTYDGVTFTRRAASTPIFLESVAAGRGMFVAVGGPGVTFTSRDATIWTPQPTSNTFLHGVGFFNNQFVGVDHDGSVATSFDGTAWTSRPTGTKQLLIAFAANENLAVAVGFGGTVLRSLPAQSPPSVATQPASVTEAVAGNVAFSVTARGSTPLAYQWRKDGRAIAGATGDTLLLPAVAMQSAGAYSCVITNSAGTATSNDAVLTIVSSFQPGSVVDDTFTMSPALDQAPVTAVEQPDGKIIIGGAFLVLNQGVAQLGLARLNSDGSLDPSFKPGPINSNGSVQALALQSDGRILVGGTFTSIGGTPRTNLARLNSDGSVDATFAPAINSSMNISDIAITANQKILITGGRQVPVRRLNPDGADDSSFSTAIFSPDFFFYRVGQQGDGKIILGAVHSTAIGTLIRLGANGTRDSSFSGVDIPNAVNSFQSLLVLPDGRLMGGYNTINGLGGVNRYLNDGSSDASFLPPSPITVQSAAAFTTDGRTWLSGTFTSLNGVPRNQLAKLDVNGSLDPSFTPGAGITSNGRASSATMLLPLSDGRVLVGGNFTRIDTTDRLYLARLNAQTNGGANVPRIVSVSPSYVEIRVGEDFTVNVAASGSAPLAFTATGPDGTRNFAAPTLKFSNVSASGVYNISASAAGSSSAATPIYVRVVPTAPIITQQPIAVQSNSGRTVALNVGAIGDTPRTYQWFRNDNPIAGATSAALTLSGVTSANAGSYTVVVRNSLGVVASDTVHVGVDEISRLANLATRGLAGAGEQSLITGFAVTGPGTKTVLIRGIGPALASFGLTGLLANPTLTVFDATGAKLAENDDWGVGSNGATAAAFAQVGAFALAAGSRDAALVTTLNPGAYTVQLSDASTASGIGLIELYEFDQLSSRLVNLSSRLMVGAGSAVAIPGIVVAGAATKRLLIRCVGPTLRTFGVQAPLADPQLTLVGPSGTPFAGNDDWSTSPNATEVATVAARVGAFPLAVGSKDAALLVDVAGGAYTALVTGANGTFGVALIEVYEVP